MGHDKPSPLAGATVRIKKYVIHPDHQTFGGEDFRVEDWWDRVVGVSWMQANGNLCCMAYALRTGLCEHNIPIDDEVLYGKVDGLGHLLHVSEVDEESKP